MTKRKIGAALVAVVALAILPAAVLFFHLIPISFNTLALLGAGAMGAFTCTYGSFQDGAGIGNGYTGGATAPTQAQASGRPLVSAQLAFTDTDTTFTLTHNMNLSAAQLAAFYPLVTITALVNQSTVVGEPAANIAVVKGANTLVLTKIQATGSGATVQIDIRRPYSPGY